VDHVSHPLLYSALTDNCASCLSWLTVRLLRNVHELLPNYTTSHPQNTVLRIVTAEPTIWTTIAAVVIKTPVPTMSDMTSLLWGQCTMKTKERHFLLECGKVQDLQTNILVNNLGNMGSEAVTAVPPAFTLVYCSTYSTLKMEAMFLRNFGWLSTDYTALYPRRWHSSRLEMSSMAEQFRCVLAHLVNYLTKQKTNGKKCTGYKTCVTFFSTIFVRYIFRSGKYIASHARDARAEKRAGPMRSVHYRCPILTRTEVCRQTLANLPYIKLHKNPFSGWAATRGQANGRIFVIFYFVRVKNSIRQHYCMLAYAEICRPGALSYGAQTVTAEVTGSTKRSVYEVLTTVSFLSCVLFNDAR
jgi:hypothetical protein